MIFERKRLRTLSKALQHGSVLHCGEDGWYGQVVRPALETFKNDESKNVVAKEKYY